MAANRERGSPWAPFRPLVALAAAITWWSGALARAPGSIASQVKNIDGASFKSNIAPQNSPPLKLVGGGTRLKYNVVKVYSIGIYIEARTPTPMKKYLGLPLKNLDKSFFDAAIKGSFPKALVLVFHRSVSADAVVDALRDALSSKLSKATLSLFRAALLKTLGEGVSRGTELTLSCKGASLRMSRPFPGAINAVNDKGICPALFNVYLGDSPVSASAKEGFASGFATMSS